MQFHGVLVSSQSKTVIIKYDVRFFEIHSVYGLRTLLDSESSTYSAHLGDRCECSESMTKSSLIV